MNLIKLLGLLFFTFTLSACGKNSIVKKIEVDTRVDANNEQIVELEAFINLGGMRLPALSIPIRDPRNAGLQIGSIHLGASPEGFNVIGLEANASRILGGQISANPMLPNGSPIPVSGVNGMVVLNIGISRIYLSGGGTPVLGLALVIPEFDEIGRYVPIANLFLPLPKEFGITGLAGVFTGGASQNGIGLFLTLPQQQVMQRSQSLAVMKTTSLDSPEFHVSDENSSSSQLIEGRLKKMSQKKRVLQIR